MVPVSKPGHVTPLSSTGNPSAPTMTPAEHMDHLVSKVKVPQPCLQTMQKSNEHNAGTCPQCLSTPAGLSQVSLQIEEQIPICIGQRLEPINSLFHASLVTRNPPSSALAT